MSTSYQPWCLDCESGEWLDDCRDEEAIQALLLLAPKLAAFWPTLRALREGTGRWSGFHDARLSLGWDRWALDLKWWEAHAGHRLTVRNEYGGCRRECAEYFDCGACGGKNERCRRARGHEGPCAKWRDRDELYQVVERGEVKE